MIKETIMRKLEDIDWTAIDASGYNVTIPQMLLNLVDDNPNINFNAHQTLYDVLSLNGWNSELAYYIANILIKVIPLTQNNVMAPSLLSYILDGNRIEGAKQHEHGMQPWLVKLEELVNQNIDVFVQWVVEETISEKRKIIFLNLLNWFIDQPTYLIPIMLKELEKDSRYSVREIIFDFLSNAFNEIPDTHQDLGFQILRTCQDLARSEDILLRFLATIALFSMSKNIFSNPVAIFTDLFEQMEENKVSSGNYKQLRNLYLRLGFALENDSDTFDLIKLEVARNTNSIEFYDQIMRNLIGPNFINIRDRKSQKITSLSEKQAAVLSIIIDREDMPLPLLLNKYRLPTDREGIHQLLQHFYREN